MPHFIQIQEPIEPMIAPLQEFVIGIDFGTTHSVVAVCHEDGVSILPSMAGELLVPSIVSYDSLAPIVGTKAFESSYIGSIKRLIGKSVNDVRSDDCPALYHLISHESSQSIIRLNVNGVLKTSIEVCADILQYLKQIAQSHLPITNCKAVITVPAYFDDAARTTIRDAASLAGIEVVRLINEPTAAAFAYGLEKNVVGKYAVYDLGGGTFDFSILNLQQGIFQVIATGGDTQLGGDDVDKIIADYVLRSSDYDASSLGHQQWTALLGHARQIKESLSVAPLVEDTLYCLDRPVNVQISQELFLTLMQPIIARTLRVVESVMNDADCDTQQLEGIILVGGSTKIPAVRNAVQEFFQQEPLCDINPDHAVAMGAAYHGYNILGSGQSVLLDVAPLSLGIETAGGLVEKVIDKNTPIPVQKTQIFTTQYDGQGAMKIHVLQGEREMAQDCRSLGCFTLGNIPSMPAGAARIEISLCIDSDGLLTVSAMEKTSNQLTNIQVNPSYGLSVDEVRKMLLDAHMHGAEDMEKSIMIKKINEAESLVLAVERTLSNRSSHIAPEHLKMLLDNIVKLRSAMKSCDHQLLTDGLRELSVSIKNTAWDGRSIDLDTVHTSSLNAVHVSS